MTAARSSRQRLGTPCQDRPANEAETHQAGSREDTELRRLIEPAEGEGRAAMNVNDKSRDDASRSEGSRAGGRRPSSPTVRIWAIADEYFTILETAQLLCVSDKRIRAYVDRDEDPMPFRCFEGKTRGAFIHRDDLYAWVMRNTVLLHDEKAKQRDGARK